MTNQHNDHGSMAPCLLLAIPQLLDPNFSKTVVLLAEHKKEGSVGFVINQPLDLKLTDILNELKISNTDDTDAIAWSGGPVLKQQGWILHSKYRGSLNPPPFRISDGLYLSGTTQHLAALTENPPEFMRVLLGSSGWGANQLETEIAEGWWLTLEIDEKLIFQTPWDCVWEACFQSMGIDPGTFTLNSSIH
ncbi:MAG: hypothetical protein CR997_07590 [Acidobacteria bacterium]|nr:MAG: hypothetical protein CR997_07590 [Acidobacteriota bacterium]